MFSYISLQEGATRNAQGHTAWAKIAKTSTDTALRDINDLVEKGILQQTDEGGRNAGYELADFKLY
jgi:Fic family protein